MSACIAITGCPNLLRISSAAVWMAGVCEQIARLAPSAAKASAAARPRPREAPVTNATRSFNPRSIEASCVDAPGGLDETTPRLRLDGQCQGTRDPLEPDGLPRGCAP